jgi:hypothetical protein
MKKTMIFTLAFLLLPATQVAAQEADYFTVLNSVAVDAPRQIDAGMMEGLDLGERTAVIGGFKYFFGPSTLAEPLDVTIMGSDYGAIEMLKDGMQVEVHYLEAPRYRIGTRLVQVRTIQEY